MTSGEMIQTEEVTVNTEPFESSEVAIAETTTTAAAIKEAIIFEDKLYTFSEISEKMEKQGIQWEDYYNGYGERIDMYCKDGSEFLFLKSRGDSKKVGSDGRTVFAGFI